MKILKCNKRTTTVSVGKKRPTHGFIQQLSYPTKMVWIRFALPLYGVVASNKKSNTHASRLYNFDTKNQKFIVFYYEGDTPQNQYHAFHLDDENDVPNYILRMFKTQ